MLLRAIRRAPPRLQYLLGTLALLLTAWVCMYGKIWSFENKNAHRFTAQAMLTGTLRMRSMITHVGHDEQVYNGAVYTNWGFGVPLLQMPFHALARATHLLHGFFPDRAIYFVYLTGTIPILWAALDHLLAMRQPADGSRGWRMAVSWAATWLVLNVILFPFMSTRFVVYEETLSYLTICELLALSAYIFALRSWKPGTIVAMALAAGVGTVVRPIGLGYLGVWGLLVLLEGRLKKAALFAAVSAPFVAFFFYSNWVRSGSIVGLGYGNSNPAWAYETPLLRFGSTCEDSAAHVLQSAARLFYAFFIYVSPHACSSWMETCHFGLEERDKSGDPYFGPGVLVLLVGMLVGLVRRRERRLTILLPYVAMAVLLCAFIARGDGFAWRYVGDFWPLIVLATVQYVYTLPDTKLLPFDRRLTRIFFWAGFAALARFLVPWEWNTRADLLPASEVAALDTEFQEARWETEGPLATKLSCGPRADVPYHNGLGWAETCAVGPYTNVYLGVPARQDDHYTLRFATEGITEPTLKVYVNGSVLTAHRVGDAYEASATIRYGALVSPNVMITVQWTPRDEPPSGKLLSIELV